MESYGDRVQFSLVTGGPVPSYQVINQLGKVMAFNGTHHFFKAEGDEFAGANALNPLTIDQIRNAASGARTVAPKVRGARVARTTTGTTVPRTTAARIAEQQAAERYAYYKENRATLPQEITEHTNEIADLMKTGASAEKAFSDIVAKYF